MLNDFISLLYPRICGGCGVNLWKSEIVVCTRCLSLLPRTGFHLEEDNPVSRIFWGRAAIHASAAYFYFRKGSAVQHLIHNLKYKGRQDIGSYLGFLYGKDLLSSTLFRDADLVMPVPLHPKKLILRGYNQSEAFARGISSSMHIPILVKALVRTRSSETQTRKGRYNRWENVSGIFTVNNPSFLHDKHIILVDDVITTGATLEACAEELLAIPGIRLSLVAIAAVTA